MYVFKFVVLYILLKLFENLRFLTTSYIISLRERAYQKFDKND